MCISSHFKCGIFLFSAMTLFQTTITFALNFCNAHLIKHLAFNHVTHTFTPQYTHKSTPHTTAKVIFLNNNHITSLAHSLASFCKQNKIQCPSKPQVIWLCLSLICHLLLASLWSRCFNDFGLFPLLKPNHKSLCSWCVLHPRPLHGCLIIRRGHHQDPITKVSLTPYSLSVITLFYFLHVSPHCLKIYIYLLVYIVIVCLYHWNISPLRV